MSDKYRNPDKRCTYPFSDCAVGYCWSYAHYVDGNPAFKDIEKICNRCEFWKPRTPAKGEKEG
jgi:hypothetical protein